VAALMGIAWRAVGSVCQRVGAAAGAQRDLLADLTRLGFDEISVGKGQRYLTVVVDHDSGRLVWAPPGRERKDRREVFWACWEPSAASVSSSRLLGSSCLGPGACGTRGRRVARRCGGGARPLARAAASGGRRGEEGVRVQ